MDLWNRTFLGCSILCSPGTLTADEDRNAAPPPPPWDALEPSLRSPQKLFCGRSSQVRTHAQLKSQSHQRMLLRELVGKQPWTTAALEETPVRLSIRCGVSQSLLVLQEEVSECLNSLHVDLILGVSK